MFADKLSDTELHQKRSEVVRKRNRTQFGSAKRAELDQLLRQFDDALADREAAKKRADLEATAAALARIADTNPDPVVSAAAHAKVWRVGQDLTLDDRRAERACRPLLEPYGVVVPEEWRASVLDAAAGIIAHLLPHTVLLPAEAVARQWEHQQVQVARARTVARIDLLADPEPEVAMRMRHNLHTCIAVDHYEALEGNARAAAEAEAEKARAAEAKAAEGRENRIQAIVACARPTGPRADVRQFLTADKGGLTRDSDPNLDWISDGVVLFRSSLYPAARKQWDRLAETMRIRDVSTARALPTSHGRPCRLGAWLDQEPLGFNAPFRKYRWLTILTAGKELVILDGLRYAWLHRQGVTLLYHAPKSPLTWQADGETAGAIMPIYLGAGLDELIEAVNRLVAATC